MRHEGHSGEGASPPARSVGEDDPVRLAVDAAEIGTWDWHVASGRVGWTPWTYQLFGYQPGAVVASYELFLGMVHSADRRSVQDWIARALRERGRTALEFRIDRPDGTVRWVRSTGRAIPDEHGEVVRMLGVVEDVTEEQQHRAFTPAGAAPRPMGPSLSARQVAHILGIADATLKRIAQAGRLKCLRSTRKNSRRFAPADVVEFLRRGSRNAIEFDAAAQAQDMSDCLVYLMEQLLAGTPLETLLDEHVRRAARVGSAPFMAELLTRLPFLVPERQRTGFPALFVQVGTPKHLDTEMIACLLHAHGHEILRPTGPLEPTQAVELAERVRARLLVLAIGSGPAGIQASGLSTAGAIASARSGDMTVCVWCDVRQRLPRGVVRVRSMRELESVLRHF